MTPEMRPIPVATANPFPGLRPFREDEAQLFFGQDDHVEDLIDRVGRKRFVAVLGGSGSGKSSLMRAGLMPRLRRGQVADGVARWVIVETQPGENPIGKLIEQMVVAFPNVAVAEEMKRDSRALARIAAKAGLHERQKVLIFVDQFEELFRYRRQTASLDGHDQADYYVQLLLEAVNDIESPIYVVLAMRTEFLGDCALFFDLAEQVNEGTYLLPRMTRDQTEQVIVGPVQHRGAAIARRLVHQLLNDAEGQEDGLPLLQHALRRVWDHWVSGKQPAEEISLANYELKLSKAERLTWPSMLHAHLNVHLNWIYETLDERRQQVARDIMRLLSERDSKGRDTRRPLAYDDLVAAFPPDLRPDVEPVIDAFRDASQGRTFLLPGYGKTLKGSMVDISHECLLRRWDRLRKWLGWEMENRRLFELLADATDGVGWRGEALSASVPPLEGFQLRMLQEWQKRTQPTAGWASRYRGAMDPELERHRREFAPAMEYLDWSSERKAHADQLRIQEQAKVERQEVELRWLRRRQRAIWFIAAGIAVGLCLAGWGWSQYSSRLEAEKLRIKAERASARAALDRDVAEQATLKAEKAEQDARKAYLEADALRWDAIQAKDNLQRTNAELKVRQQQLIASGHELGIQIAITTKAERAAIAARDAARLLADNLKRMNVELAQQKKDLEQTVAQLEESKRSEEFQKAGNRTQLGLQAAATDPDQEQRIKRAHPLLDDYRQRSQARAEIPKETLDVFKSGFEAISQALEGNQIALTKNVGAGMANAAYSTSWQEVIGLLPVAGLSLLTHPTNGTSAVQPLKIRHLGHTLFEPGRDVRAFDISPGGQYIAMGTEGGRVTVFERTASGPEPYRRIFTKRPRWTAATLVRFSRDGRLLLTAAEKGGWTLFDLDSRRETAQDEKSGRHLAQASLSSDGHWLAYTTDKQGVVVQSIGSRGGPLGSSVGAARVLVPDSTAAGGSSRPIDISNDGWVITSSAEGALELHTGVDQHSDVFRGDARQSVSAVQLSPAMTGGAEWLAVADRRGVIALYEWAAVKAAVLKGGGQLPEPRVKLRPGLGKESKVVRLTWQNQMLTALDESGTVNIWKPFAAPERLALLANVQRMLQQPQMDMNDLAAILREIAKVFELSKPALARR